MGLQASAFEGANGQDPRLPVLQSLETLDVEACPGSGKTTLLVAKLAILARRWATQGQGLCVLSHTNAARDEIAKRLGSSSEGRALLQYPHYVGTIHGFVNEFMAVPYLRSLGNPIKVIDSDVTIARRWAKLPWNTRSYLEQRGGAAPFCIYTRPDFGGGRPANLGEQTATYAKLNEVCKTTSEEGYFCFHEMFIWARQLMQKQPFVTQDIRRRFPLLFIDEVQDNDEDQSSLLFDLFMAGANPVKRQRFGDSNQAIYSSADGAAAATDPFPAAAKVDLPNSFRFGQQIATLAKPLGVVPQELVGLNPEPQVPPAIFLFDDASIGSVLPAYGRYLTANFSAEDLMRGPVTAVAGVHTGDENNHVPRRVGHYATEYDPGVTRKVSVPESFCLHVRLGWREAQSLSRSEPIVRNVAEAMIDLLQRAGEDVWKSRFRNPHRYLLARLESAAGKDAYLTMQKLFAAKSGTINEAFWNGDLQSLFGQVFTHLTGKVIPPTVSDFLKWDGLAADDPDLARNTNIYRYEENGSSIAIRLGSIHSVKGETHLATLVLESYRYEHQLLALRPWLIGPESGGAGKANRTQERLRLHYVGMTRPARLLCLAMRTDTLQDGDLATLMERGWTAISCLP
jgi:hypothetical protein